MMRFCSTLSSMSLLPGNVKSKSRSSILDSSMRIPSMAAAFSSSLYKNTRFSLFFVSGKRRITNERVIRFHATFFHHGTAQLTVRFRQNRINVLERTTVYFHPKFIQSRIPKDLLEKGLTLARASTYKTER